MECLCGGGVAVWLCSLYGFDCGVSAAWLWWFLILFGCCGGFGGLLLGFGDGFWWLPVG